MKEFLSSIFLAFESEPKILYEVVRGANVVMLSWAEAVGDQILRSSCSRSLDSSSLAFQEQLQEPEVDQKVSLRSLVSAYPRASYILSCMLLASLLEYQPSNSVRPKRLCPLSSCFRMVG